MAWCACDARTSGDTDRSCVRMHGVASGSQLAVCAEGAKRLVCPSMATGWVRRGACRRQAERMFQCGGLAQQRCELLPVNKDCARDGRVVLPPLRSSTINGHRNEAITSISSDSSMPYALLA
jgi:hypothetical protein